MEGLGLYDRVVTYDAALAARGSGPCTWTSRATPAVRGRVHGHFGEALASDCVVGASHWDQPSATRAPGRDPRPRFSSPRPGHKRTADWGADGLQAGSATPGPVRRLAFGLAAGRSGSGPEHLERAYLALVEGNRPGHRLRGVAHRMTDMPGTWPACCGPRLGARASASECVASLRAGRPGMVLARSGRSELVLALMAARDRRRAERNLQLDQPRRRPITVVVLLALAAFLLSRPRSALGPGRKICLVV